MGSSSSRVPQAVITDVFPATDPQSLYDGAEDVQGMLSHPGWAHVKGVLASMVESIDAKLDASALPDPTVYAFEHGQRKGLLMALNVADAIIARADRVQAEQRALYGTAGDPVEDRSAR